MNYAVTISLTFISLCSILILTLKGKKKYFAKIVYTQSSLHQVVKHLLPKDFFELPLKHSQASKFLEENMIKVIVLEDSAYWVHNNMFYKADAVDGQVYPETAQPIDTNNMSKWDIDKMLSILDSLKNGNSDDSGSTRNKRI